MQNKTVSGTMNFYMNYTKLRMGKFMFILATIRNNIEYLVKRIVFGVVFFMLSGFGFPQKDAVLKLSLPNASLNYALIVYDPLRHKILYQKNSDRLFIPASNMKLFTAYAALKYLGPQYTFSTSLYADPSGVQNQILQGNVYLKMTGDPSLSFSELNTLIQALAEHGIKKITGQLIVSGARFDPTPFGPGWMWDDAGSCDGVAANGVIVDHNCFHMDFWPGPDPKAHNRWLLYYKTSGTVIPFAVQQHISIDQNNPLCSIHICANTLNQYQLSGCLDPTVNNAKNFYALDIAINNSDIYIQQLLQMALKYNQIELEGPILFSQANPPVPLLKSISSPPLIQLVRFMLKTSDNLYANVLFEKMAERATEQPATWTSSQTTLKTLIEKQLGIPANRWSTVDGSGISRYDLVSPEQILALLNQAYHDPSLSDLLVNSLPIAGIDGTLKGRMMTPDLKGNVFAKTGSMTGVSALSGYIKTQKGHTLIFVMLINNFLGPQKPYRDMQDKLCEEIYRRG